MPTYCYRCLTCSTEKEEVRSVADRNKVPWCHGLPMSRVLTVPMAFVRDVHYTSPVDGRPITSLQAHREELARTDSIVYEPGIKQDQERNERRRSWELERKVDETVEREIATMPPRKLEKLATELDHGASAEAVRSTAGKKPIVERIER